MKGAFNGFLSKIGLTESTGTKPAQRVQTVSTDESSHDPTLSFLLRNVRSKLQRQIFFQNSPETLTENRDVKILVASYNVNGKKPPDGSNLKPLIGTWAEDAASRPGIVVVGFQEIVPLSASNVIVGSGLTNIRAWDRLIAIELNGEAWTNGNFDVKGGESIPAVMQGLDQKWDGSPRSGMAQLNAGGTIGNEATYFQVASKQLVGIYSSVWVHKALLPFVKGVQAAVVSTGFGGYLGNKGAVAVRMFVFDSPLCFVNAHLSSGSKEGDETKRNADVAEVLQRCDFAAASQYGDQSMAFPSTTLLASSLGQGQWGSMKSIEDHPSAIWLGDLNYRLHLPSGISDVETIKTIRAGHLEALLEKDQLCREMAAKRVFKGWAEAKLTFAPTFKFKLGTHSYLGESAGDVPDADDVEEEPGETTQKKRTPAWCDRILSRGGQLNQVTYFCGEITASDHKPVAADFLMRAKHYNRRKVDDLLSAACRKAEIMQASMRPRPSLSPNLITIGELSYGEERTFSVTLSNSGPVEGIFHFIPPPNSDYNNDDPTPSLPAWLKALPDEGIVPAGGSVEIELHVCVEGGSEGAAAMLAVAPNDFLDAIVILRVEDGSDMFLSLTGTYRKSSWLGIPLDSISTSVSSRDLVVVPWQISSLVSALETAEALATPGLFVLSTRNVLSTSHEEAETGALPVAGLGACRVTERLLLRRLRPLVETLEHPDCILPVALSPHEAAALLLVMLGQLPKALVPNIAILLIEAAIEAGQLPDPEMVPDLLLTDVMTPVELATLKMILELINKVAASPATDVRTNDLISLLSGCLLSPLPPHAPAEARARRERALRSLLD